MQRFVQLAKSFKSFVFVVVVVVVAIVVVVFYGTD